MTTVDKTEVEKFSRLAKDWWNPKGKFKPLHLFNPARIKFIKEKLVFYYKRNLNSEQPLKELKILDIGCGGGLLCETLTRLGASMTGIAASKNIIKLEGNNMLIHFHVDFCESFNSFNGLLVISRLLREINSLSPRR